MKLVTLACVLVGMWGVTFIADKGYAGSIESSAFLIAYYILIEYFGDD